MIFYSAHFREFKKRCRIINAKFALGWPQLANKGKTIFFSLFAVAITK
jgi:hypothetical protein